MNKLESIFKDQKTNWKYLLIVIVLAFFVDGGILAYQYWWVPKYEIPLIEFSRTKKPLDNEILQLKQEMSSDEMILIFKKIFPKGITNSDLDNISDLKERAEIFFENSTVGYEELNGIGKDELIITTVAQWLVRCAFPDLPGSWPYFKDGDIRGHLVFRDNLEEGGWFEFPEEWFTQEKKSPRWQVSPNENCYETSNSSYTLIIDFSKTPNLFPINQTLAEEKFQPLIAYNKEDMALWVEINKEMMSIKLFGYTIVPRWVEKWILPGPAGGMFYVLHWNDEEWNLVGDIFFGFRSSLQILNSRTNGFKDILYRNALSAGSYEINLYKWNGNKYIREEKAVCDLNSKSDICKLQGDPLHWRLHE